jgi:hypothetical protein
VLGTDGALLPAAPGLGPGGLRYRRRLVVTDSDPEMFIWTYES